MVKLKFKKIYIIYILIISIIAIVILFNIKINFNYKLSVGLVYAEGSKTYEATYQRFDNSLIMNCNINLIKVESDKKQELDKYDLLWLDDSLLNIKDSEELKSDLIEYTKSGGTLFVENNFNEWFPKDFLGAKEFKELSKFPDNINLPTVSYDLQNVQRLLNDFYQNYKYFKDINELKEKNYGKILVASTAEPILSTDIGAMYSVNKFEKGYVFFASLLLPNPWYISSYDLEAKDGEQKYFNNSVAAADQMLQDEILSFISKKKYGYAIKKVLGPNGRPAMAWQNHFEVLSAIKDNSFGNWIEVNKKYDEIPSYSLARGVYEWFIRRESIGYQMNESDGNNLLFSSNSKESLYAPGKHPIVDGKWLNLAKCPNNESYFTKTKSNARAYPYIEDINKDGVLDILCGSSDGYFYFYKGIENIEDWILNKPENVTDANGKPIKVDGYSAPVCYDVDGDENKEIISGEADGKIVWFKNNGDFTFTKKGEFVKLPEKDELTAPTIGDINNDGIVDLVIGTKNGNLYIYNGRKEGNAVKFLDPHRLEDVNGKPLNIGNNLAPAVLENEIIVGNGDGYLVRLKSKENVIENVGFITQQFHNDFGNNNIKHGDNAVPVFADLNNDGKKDLIVGRLEYGEMAVDITSKWFPYREELKTAIFELKKIGAGLIPHVYTNIYNDTEHEKEEIELTKRALESYDIQWKRTRDEPTYMADKQK
jgi:hypothetical protein